MIIDKQKNCKYCHATGLNKGGNQYGIKAHTYTQYYDWQRKRNVRKQVSVSILSPENKHPRLRSVTRFHTGPENNFDIPIDFCPWCGRELHQENNN